MSFLGKIGDAVKTISTGGFASTDVARAIPGIGDRIATQEANEQNVRLDKMNRDWMERMSNSAYQRAMDDMKKAGLNPMLAYQQGGASVPSTTAPTAAAASATGLFDAGVKAFTGISNTRTAQQQANTAQAAAESTINLQAAQAAKEVKQMENTAADTELKKRELKGKGLKDTIDREGGLIMQKVINTLKNSAKPNSPYQKMKDVSEKAKADLKKNNPKAYEALTKPLY